MTDFSISDSLYAHKTRIRVCGLLEDKGKILLIKHDGIGPEGYLWAPPGGGLEFGKTTEECLVKEFLEETNLHIKVGSFLFVNEYLDDRFHAIELFYLVKRISGDPKLGKDPEVPHNEQILSDLKFWDYEEIKNLSSGTIHNSFWSCEHPSDIIKQRGFIRFANI
ncbi:MAG: NUDIX domain-containing protein [Cyclobacteriaceae bacterium]